VNTETGRVYELGEDLVQKLSPRFAEPHKQLVTAMSSVALDRPLTNDEFAAATDAARGERIVPISGDVAQRLRLGERELERRKKRRNAAKDSRRRNR
jgi:hypothetical protein